MNSVKKELLELAAENAFQNKDPKLANALWDESDRVAVDEEGLPEDKHNQLQEALVQETLEEESKVAAHQKWADAALNKWLTGKKWFDKERKRKVKFDSLPKKQQSDMRKRMEKQVDARLDSEMAKGKFYNKEKKRKTLFKGLSPRQQGETRRRLQKQVLETLG
jgi:hypothetical protein